MLKSINTKLFGSQQRCFTQPICFSKAVLTTMPASMFLDDEEIVTLTGRKRRRSQTRALKFMGIEHRLRPDGTVAVSRAHVEQVLGVVLNGGALRDGDAEAEPNWSMI